MAYDEADANKIKKAEKRAAAKFKSSQEKKRKSNAEFSTSAPTPNNASRFSGPSGFSFPPTQSRELSVLLLFKGSCLLISLFGVIQLELRILFWISLKAVEYGSFSEVAFTVFD